MTNEERDALIERARKTPWLDAMKRRETEALLAALGEARAQLAALHAAARGYREQRMQRIAWMEADGRPRDGQAHALRRAAEAIDDCLACLATAAREHDALVRAPVEAERDTLAMALSEVRGCLGQTASDHEWTTSGQKTLVHIERDDTREHIASGHKKAEDEIARLVLAANDGVAVRRALSALPADLAAHREARIRADERAKVLREARGRLDLLAVERSSTVVWEMLNEMADEAEVTR